MERGRHSQILEQRLNVDGAKSTRITSSLGLITTSIIIMIILVDNFHWHHISKVPASLVLSSFFGLPTSTLTSSPFRMVMMVTIIKSSSYCRLLLIMMWTFVIKTTMTKVPCILFSTETRMYLLIYNLIAPIVKWMQGADETEVKITQNNAAMS